MDAVKGRDEGFVVREQGKGPSFKEETEVTDSQKRGQKFAVKGRVAFLCRGQLLGIKSEGLPAAARTLLKDGPHMGVRRVRGEGEFSMGEGVRQGNSRDKGVLGSLESSLKGRRPGKTASPSSGVREGGQRAGNTGEETPVKI
jgi:hypothetical protein